MTVLFQADFVTLVQIFRTGNYYIMFTVVIFLISTVIITIFVS